MDMPIYEYRCLHCGRRARIHLSYDEYDRATPACPYCGHANLKRRIGRVGIARSEDSRLETLIADDSLAGLEDDPRAMGRFMRQMSNQMGEDMGDELEEVAGRLERGESMESIERSLPELADPAIPGDDLD